MEFPTFSCQHQIFNTKTYEGKRTQNNAITFVTFEVDSIIYLGCTCRKSRTALILLLLEYYPGCVTKFSDRI